MIKKVKIFLPIIFVVSIFIVSLSLAFITKEVNTHNVLTFGSIKMRLIEKTIENGVLKDIKDGENFNITNNSNVNRIIKVQNIGKHPMYVRIGIKVNASEDRTCFDISRFISFKQNDNDWVYKDGWYYYKYKVALYEDTRDLKVDITFDINEITKRYNGIKFNLDVTAEAVQSENNSDNVFDAVGWPS